MVLTLRLTFLNAKPERDTFCVPIPHELSDFAATTIHTMALAFSACQAIIDKDEASTIVVQGN